MDLLNAFNTEDLNEITTRDTILRAPMAYPGGKSRSIAQILPHLPLTGVYCEPFGGSAAVLLARPKSALEIYNDRYGGIVSFYRCLRDREKCDALIERLDCSIHSREEFVHARENWENQSVYNDVERAALWFYTITYSFASLGRNFGRSTSARSPMSMKMANKIKDFPALHERLRSVQIENQDGIQCIKDYDSSDTVFYLDPPYVDAHKGTYKHEMTHQEHRNLIDVIFHCKGFVAVSGYANPLYDNQLWDARHEWESFVSISPRAFTEENFKAHLEGVDKRTHAKEVLWIKEAN